MAATLEVLGAYDEKLIRKVPFTGKRRMEKALADARALADDPTKRIPVPERTAILERTRRFVEENYDRIAADAAAEGGKPLVDTRAEITRAVNGIKVAAESLAGLAGEEIPMGMNAASMNRMAFTFREPIGVAVAVSAFNHPFNLAVHQVIPAVAVGCPVIIKPALETPLSCLNLLEALHESGLPGQWARAVVVDDSLSERLATDRRVDYLTFIGSAEVGWRLRSKLAPGARCALEHGGAAPVIAEPDADVDDMLPLLAKGGFYHAGQVCVSVQRVFAHRSIVKKVAAGLRRLASKAKVGDPLAEDTDIGPLISRADVSRVDRWVGEAVGGGGKLLCGGRRIGKTCYEPTVILDPPRECRLSREEIFGPVVAVYAYDDTDEAVSLANGLPYSFQAAVFTKNVDKALEVVRKIKASSVLVNDHTAFRVDWMPFRGAGRSGIGTGGIPYTMREMTHEKLMVVRSPSITP